MNTFFDQCFDKDNTVFKYYNAECSNKVLQDLGVVSSKDIDECISGSFVVTGDYSSDNLLL